MEKRKKIAAAVTAVIQYIDDEKKRPLPENNGSSAWKFFGRHLNFNVRYLIQTKMFNR